MMTYMNTNVYRQSPRGNYLAEKLRFERMLKVNFVCLNQCYLNYPVLSRILDVYSREFLSDVKLSEI